MLQEGIESTMTTRKGLRPGGRSARVQEAVHRAVRGLQQEHGRDGLTVPAIAARAGVTPSTIYRRWGDLPQLLSDVAVEHLLPDSLPPDTGSFRQDMEHWLAQYLEEMSSEVGRTLLRDVLSCADPLNAGQCARCIEEQLDRMREQALARGETPPACRTLMDYVIAPLVYRILFAAEAPAYAFAQTLLDRVLARVVEIEA
ncbi:TetR/AcrR family transcriptional regulator [Burkholderia ubonensis]|uniref:TetR/AcrR family transcriptional regulator n=1 Tax=Burkholderia ubonensis TaxID=101571 RepID=UPI00210A01D5|nr:TetR/AcrR family transcriptional regulator [Burkholderia ubonensis]